MLREYGWVDKNPLFKETVYTVKTSLFNESLRE